MRYPVLLFMIDTLNQGTKPGLKPHLNAYEEKELCNFVCEMGKLDIRRHCDRSRMLLKQLPKRKAFLERKRHPMDGLDNS